MFKYYFDDRGFGHTYNQYLELQLCNENLQNPSFYIEFSPRLPFPFNIPNFIVYNSRNFWLKFVSVSLLDELVYTIFNICI